MFSSRPMGTRHAVSETQFRFECTEALAETAAEVRATARQLTREAAAFIARAQELRAQAINIRAVSAMLTDRPAKTRSGTAAPHRHLGPVTDHDHRDYSGRDAYPSYAAAQPAGYGLQGNDPVR